MPDVGIQYMKITTEITTMAFVCGFSGQGAVPLDLELTLHTTLRIWQRAVLILVDTSDCARAYQGGRAFSLVCFDLWDISQSADEETGRAWKS